MSSNDVNEQLLWEQIALKKQSISTLKSSINDKRKDVSSKKKLVNLLLSEIETARKENTPLIDEDAKWTQISTLKSEINTLITSIKSTREIIKDKENTVEDNIDLLQDNALEGVELPPPLEKVLSVSRLQVNDNTTIAGSLKVNNNLNVSGNIYFDNSANLTNLIVNNNTNLNKLVVDNSTNLTDLTVTNNTNLNELVVDNSANLTNLIVNNNTNLNKLVVDNSTNLTDLNVLNSSNLYNLNVTNKSYLKDISGTNLDISNNFKVNNKFNLADRFILDNSNNIIVKTNIIPDLSNVYTLGTLEKPFMDLFLGPSSLYINGTKVISADQAEEMKIETTTNQNLTIQTSGTGVFKLQSNADMNLNTVGVNSDINLTTSGGIKVNSVLGLVFATNKGIKYQDNKIVLSGDVVIDGSLNVNGKQTTIDTEALNIKDNIVVLNSNQLSNPEVGFQSGFEVIRGNRPSYHFKFRDLGANGGVFEVGEDGDLQPVVTRKESNLMTDKGVLYWDNSNNRLDTFDNIRFSNGSLNLINSSKLLIEGIDVLENIDTSLNSLQNQLINFNGSLWEESNNTIYYTTGNVGIGLNNPASKLHINSSNMILSNPGERSNALLSIGGKNDVSNNTYIAFINPSITDQSISGMNWWSSDILFGRDRNKAFWGFKETHSISFGNSYKDFITANLIDSGGYTRCDNIQFLTNSVLNAQSVERMRITSNGNIGINRSNPQIILEISAINNVSNANNGLRISTTGTVGTNSYRFADWRLKSDSGGAFRLGLDVNNDSRYSSVEDVISVRLASGNVGIGTTNPQGKLDVNGQIKTQSLMIQTFEEARVLLGRSIRNNTTEQRWYKIASLPVSSGSTYDHIVIEGTIGGYLSNEKFGFRCQFINRNGFRSRFIAYDNIINRSSIECYNNSGVIDIYIKHILQFSTMTYNITDCLQATIIDPPIESTTTPTGTLVFDSLTSIPEMIFNGNSIGIGTITPQARLHIQHTNSSGTAINLLRTNYDNNWGLRLQQNFTGSGNIQYDWIHRYSSTDYNSLTFKGANVGIGSTSPNEKLDVLGNVILSGDGNYRHLTIQSRTSNTAKQNSTGLGAYLRLDGLNHSGIMFDESTNEGTCFIRYNGVGSGAGNYLAFGSHISGWVQEGGGLNYIPQNGRVGIGITNPSYKLHVVGDIFASGDITGLSDVRFKENIINLENCLDKVSKLRGVYYNLKGSEERKIGMIAQEVEEQFPELVKSTEESKSLNYSNLVGVLVEAIKDLKQEIINLKEENTTIKNDLNIIKKLNFNN